MTTGNVGDRSTFHQAGSSVSNPSSGTLSSPQSENERRVRIWAELDQLEEELPPPSERIPSMFRQDTDIKHTLCIFAVLCVACVFFSIVGFIGANQDPLIHNWVGRIGHNLGNVYSGVMMGFSVLFLVLTVPIYCHFKERTEELSLEN